MIYFDVTFLLEFPALNEIINANRTTRTVTRKDGRKVRLSKGASQKKQYTNLVDKMVSGKVSPLPEETPLVWHFHWICKNRKHDPDNISAGAKFIFDGLQKAGIITGDGWKQVSAILHTFEVGKPVGVRVIAAEQVAYRSKQ